MKASKHYATWKDGIYTAILISLCIEEMHANYWRRKIYYKMHIYIYISIFSYMNRKIKLLGVTVMTTLMILLAFSGLAHNNGTFHGQTFFWSCKYDCKKA